jgi:hypothetical protein
MTVTFLPQVVISGGQTGADRGGLIAAMQLGYKCGGWVPKGRLAEDGVVPPEFPVTECSSSHYPTRTRLNVQRSDATVVFGYSKVPTGGTALTMRLAEENGKSCFWVVLGPTPAKDQETADDIREWLEVERPMVLNVAGSRESKAPGIQEHVTRIMLLTLAR